MNTPASNMFELRKGECRKKKEKNSKKKQDQHTPFVAKYKKMSILCHSIKDNAYNENMLQHLHINCIFILS